MTEFSGSRDALARVTRRAFEDANTVSEVVTCDRDERIYTTGQMDSSVYYLQRGQVKLLVISPDGKECITAIHADQAIFGELCLCGESARMETAVAMRSSILRRISSKAFMNAVAQENALHDLVKYLAFRLHEQQDLIATLLTAGSEHRLAKALLTLAVKLGRDDGTGRRVAPHILQEELAEMVGTTRSYVGVFLRRFKDRGLISETENHSLMIHESRMRAFLGGLPLLPGEGNSNGIAPGRGPERKI